MSLYKSLTLAISRGGGGGVRENSGEASTATPSIAKSDYPAGCLVPSSEYKLNYSLRPTIFGRNFLKDTKLTTEKYMFLM